jgi:hypothetical protein
MKGTKAAAPKAPQGDLYVEAGSGTDSAAPAAPAIMKIDSSIATKTVK